MMHLQHPYIWGYLCEPPDISFLSKSTGKEPFLSCFSPHDGCG
jgi:hypothetical protein